jgi:Holliday junction resolvase RusA-like endonuclease
MTMPDTISFFVAGLPSPGGSKKAFRHSSTGKTIVLDMGGQRTKDWRASVAHVASAYYAGPLLDVPLIVTMTFVMPRPKGHYGKRGLLGRAPTHHTKAPDALKLARSTEDALTGVIWKDDATTVELRIAKVYGDRPGALIEVTPIG